MIFTLEEAEEAHQRFFELYKGLAAWHEYARHEAPRVLLTRTASGRLRHLSAVDPKLANRFLCTPIQGTEADSIKRAVALAYHHLAQIGAYIVNVIHDEMVIEAPEQVAEQAKAILVWAMKEGMSEFIKKVPVEVSAIVTGAWVKP